MDLSDLARLSGWQRLKVEGKPPNAVSGYATVPWEAKGAILVSGGVDAKGKTVADIFMLQLPQPASSAGPAQVHAMISRVHTYRSKNCPARNCSVHTEQGWWDGVW